jgi:hypothetical protein
MSELTAPLFKTASANRARSVETRSRSVEFSLFLDENCEHTIADCVHEFLSLEKQGFLLHELILPYSLTLNENFLSLISSIYQKKASPTLEIKLLPSDLDNGTLEPTLEGIKSNVQSHLNLNVCFLIRFDIENFLEFPDLFYKPIEKLTKICDQENDLKLTFTLEYPYQESQIFLDNYDQIFSLLNSKIQRHFEIRLMSVKCSPSIQVEYFKNFYDDFPSSKFDKLTVSIGEQNKTSFTKKYFLLSNKKLSLLAHHFYPIIDHYQELSIDPITQSNILKKINDSQSSQFVLANSIECCSSCNNLNNCVGKNSLYLMNRLEQTKCLYSEKLLKELKLT